MTVPDARGCVYVVATPIGNLGDLSERAARTLRDVAVIACEDTRRTARLCARHGIATRRVSLHAHNEARRVPQLLHRVHAGESIAVVSDAGTPLLSDPGARLVEAAHREGIRVVPIPGASAVLAALVASGLPTRPFAFFGFLPRRGSERADWLERVRDFPGTAVLFEAPGRVAATLEDLAKVVGPREVAIARELTKRHEEVTRGKLGEFELETPRGEVTLVIGPPAPGARSRTRAAETPDPEPEALAAELLAEGWTRRDAAREVARRTGIARGEAYDITVRSGTRRDRG